MLLFFHLQTATGPLASAIPGINHIPFSMRYRLTAGLGTGEILAGRLSSPLASFIIGAEEQRKASRLAAE